MAEPKASRKPRIRKAPLTLREQAEVARSEVLKKETRQDKVAAKATRRFFSRLSSSSNPLLQQLRKVGRVFKKIFGWLLPTYFLNSWREVRQVTWPSRRETWRLTGAVFIFAVVFGALVAGVDKGLDEFFKKVILK